MASSLEDYSLIATITYFSIYALIFFGASIVAAASVRKEMKQRKKHKKQLEINVHVDTQRNTEEQMNDIQQVTDTNDNDNENDEDDEKTNTELDELWEEEVKIDVVVDDDDDNNNKNQSGLIKQTPASKTKDDWKWYTPIQKWFKSVQKKRKIYISLIPHIFDQATDLGVLFEYYHTSNLGDKSDINNEVNTAYLFGVTIFVLILHRIVSGYAVYRLTHKWFDVMLQMFDLLMVKCVWINYQLDVDEPSNSQRYLQVLEATFESSPQLLISMGYLAKIGLSEAPVIIIISTLASLFSLTSRIAADDKAMFIGKMQNADFHFKSLISCDLFNAINLWYILRVILWRFMEMTTRIFLCTLIWINIGGLSLFIILGCEFAYIMYVCFKLKTIDIMGSMVYTTFATGSVDDNEEPIIHFESSNIKIYKRELYLLVFGVYRIISSFLYLILLTIFTTTRFEANKVPDYDDRHGDTIEDSFVLFMLVYTWIGSCFWPISMLVTAVANEGLRSNARDVLKLIENGYILELMQLIEFGSECPYNELCDIFTGKQRILIIQRLVTNSNPKTWELCLVLLQHLNVTKDIINEKQYSDHNEFVSFLKDVQQSQNIPGGTILHYAVKYSSYDIVTFLISKSANITILCDENHSLYYYAKYERDQQLKDTAKITNLINNMNAQQSFIPSDYNWKLDQENAKKERERTKIQYQQKIKQLNEECKEDDTQKKENDEKLKNIEKIKNQKISDKKVKIEQYWKSDEWKLLEKENKSIEDIREHDLKIKDEINQIQQQLKVITDEERDEREQKVRDLFIVAARETLPALPILCCIAMLPIVFIVISLIASIMAVNLLFDDDIYALNCATSNDLRINELNIDGYRFEAIILLIFSCLQCCITGPSIFAVIHAIRENEEEGSAIGLAACNVPLIIVEIIIMFHLSYVWSTADCSRNDNLHYSLDSMVNVYQTWCIITIIITLFAIWSYSFLRRLLLDYVKNQNQISENNDYEFFNLSKISDLNVICPCCCGSFSIFLWILLTIITMIMSAYMILEFNENCYRFNGSAKIEFSALFLVCCLSLSIPIRVFVYIHAIAEVEYRSNDNTFFERPEILFDRPSSLLTIIKSKIAEFCCVICCQVILMFHSFLYWNDISLLDNDDCTEETYFTAKDFRDTSIAWLTAFFFVLLFIFLLIRSLNLWRDSLITQAVEKLEAKQGTEDASNLFLVELYGKNAYVPDTYGDIEPHEASSANNLCVIFVTFFIFIVWMMCSLIISFVAVLISFKIGSQCELKISSSNTVHNLNSNKEIGFGITYMMVECILLALLTLISLRLSYFFLRYIFDNYDSHHPEKTAKVLIRDQKHSKLFITLWWIASGLQFIIMLHLCVIFEYDVDCGYFFNFQMNKAIIVWMIFYILMVIAFIYLYAVLNKLYDTYIEHKDNMINTFKRLEQEKTEEIALKPQSKGVPLSTLINELNIEKSDDIIELAQKSSFAELSSASPVFCCLYLLWIILSISSSSLAVDLLFDTNITLIYSECDDDLLINDTNLDGYRAEVIILLIVSLLSCCILPIGIGFVMMHSYDRKDRAFASLGGLCCMMSIQLGLIVHLYFVFGYVHCNYNAIKDILPSSPKKVSKMFLACIAIVALSIVIFIILYSNLRKEIFKKINKTKENIFVLTYEKFSRLSVVIPIAVYFILMPLLAILTLIIGCMACAMSFSSNVAPCGKHDMLGRIIGFIVFLNSIIMFLGIIIIYFAAITITYFLDSFTSRNFIYSPISMLTEAKSLLDYFLFFLVTSIILIFHQFSYWNSIDGADCDLSDLPSTFYTVKDIRNACLLWIIIVIIITFCVYRVIQQSNSIRNVIMDITNKEIEDFDDAKQSAFIEQIYVDRDYDRAVDPPQVSSTYVICIVFITICLYSLWTTLTFIISTVGLLISLHQYIPFFHVGNINNSSFTSINSNQIFFAGVTYLMLEQCVLIIISIVSYYYASKIYKLIYYHYDCYNQAKSPKTLISENPTFIPKLFSVYFFQFLIMLHLLLVFGYDVNCDALNWNKINISHLILAWFCSSIGAMVLYRLVIHKKLNSLNVEVIDYQNKTKLKLDAILTKIENMKTEEAKAKEMELKQQQQELEKKEKDLKDQKEKMKQVLLQEIMNKSQLEIFNTILDNILILHQDSEFQIEILENLLSCFESINLGTMYTNQNYTVLDLLRLTLPQQYKKAAAFLLNTTLRFNEALQLFLMKECEMIKKYFIGDTQEIVMIVCKYFNDINYLFEYQYERSEHPEINEKETYCKVQSVLVSSYFISIEIEHCDASSSKYSSLRLSDKTQFTVQYESQFEYTSNKCLGRIVYKINNSDINTLETLQSVTFEYGSSGYSTVKLFKITTDTIEFLKTVSDFLQNDQLRIGSIEEEQEEKEILSVQSEQKQQESATHPPHQAPPQQTTDQEYHKIEDDGYSENQKETYSVEFTAKPFGLTFGQNKEDKKNLFVTKIDEDSEASRGNVIVGSKIVKLQNEIVEDLGARKIYKLFNDKYGNQLPLTITFKKAKHMIEKVETDNVVEANNNGKTYDNKQSEQNRKYDGNEQNTKYEEKVEKVEKLENAENTENEDGYIQ